MPSWRRWKDRADSCCYGDTRIATTSIPPDQLSRILHGAIDNSDLEQRMLVFNLYLQMERFRDARAELEKIFDEFPQAEAKYGQFVRTLRQLEALRVIREIELRGDGGQHAAKVCLPQGLSHRRRRR